MSRPAAGPLLLASLGWAVVAAILTPVLLPPLPAYRTAVAAAAMVLFAAALAAPRGAFVLAVLSVTAAGASALAFGSHEPLMAGPIVVAGYLAGASLKRIYDVGDVPPRPPLLVAWRAFVAASAVSAVAGIVVLRTSYLFVRDVPPPRTVNVLGAGAPEALLGVVAVLASLLVAAGMHGATARLNAHAHGRRAIDTALVGAALLAGGVAVLQKVGALPLWRAARWHEWNRAQSTFTDPSAAGVAVALLIAPILARATTGGKAMRFFAIATVPLLLVVLTDAGSRAGLIGTLTASGIYVLWGLARLAAGAGEGTRRRVASTVATLAILSGLALAAALSWPNRGAVRSALIARIEAPLRKEPTPFETNRERLLLYEGAWEIFKEHPVVGIGLAGFRTELPNIAAEVVMRPVRATDHPPSLYLGTLAETGLAGALLLFLLLGGVVRGAGQALALNHLPPDEALPAAGAAAACIGLLVVFLFGSHLVYPEIAAYVGLLTARLPLRPDGRTARLLTALVPVVLAGALVLLLGGVLARCWETRTPDEAFRRSDDAGVYGEEHEASGRAFRWTASSAAWRLASPPALGPRTRRPSGWVLTLPVKNARPDGETVLVDVFWDDQLRGRVALPATGWKSLRLPVSFRPPAEDGPAVSTGVLRIAVSETFRPTSREDNRQLGIETGVAPTLAPEPSP
jgi:O-antigen ligase